MHTRQSILDKQTRYDTTPLLIEALPRNPHAWHVPLKLCLVC